MVVLRSKGIQQSFRNLVLRAAAYDTARKQNIVPIQETKEEHMKILKQKKARL